MDRATTAAQLRLHLARSGLTLADAARLPDMPDHRTLRRWLGGARDPDPRSGKPYTIQPERLDAVYALIAAQDHVAAETVRLYRSRTPKPTRIEIRLAANDAEAALLGYPSVGAHLAVLRRVAEALTPVPVIAVYAGESAVADMAADKHRGGESH